MKETKIDYEIFVFSKPEDLLNDKQEFDIAILDIELKDQNGIDLAKALNNTMPQCKIIFLTSYIEYSTDVYEAEHIWFVLKTDSSQKLPKAIQKALKSIETESIEEYIVTKKNSIVTRIPLKNILYITKVNRKTEIHCLDNKYYNSRKADDLIPTELKDRFLRCHQGYVINLSAVKELDRNEFILINNERIPISRKYKETAKQEFFEQFHIN